MGLNLLKINYFTQCITDLYSRRNDIIVRPSCWLGVPVSCLIDVLEWDLEALYKH